MSRITWDNIGERLYETGVDNVVLFPIDTATNKYDKGVGWNGVSAVNEKPSGAEASAVYANNKQYLNMTSAEKYDATLEAYMSPDEFDECDGSVEVAPGVSITQQPRKMFGFVYRTLIGNDVMGDNYGYEIHFVYGCKAAPSERNHSTVNEDPEASTLSWEISTTPVEVAGYKPTAHLKVDSTKMNAEKLKALEDIIYGKNPSTEGGDDGTDARLPLPDEIVALVGQAAG